MTELTNKQLICLQILAERATTGGYLSGYQIGTLMTAEQINAWVCREMTEPYFIEKTRGLIIANRIGPTMASLAREGYVVEHPNPWRRLKRWKLGPKSDLLKEQGILDE